MLFLYKQQLESVAHSLLSGSLNVTGARLTGKSTFLREFSQRLKRQGRRVAFLEGARHRGRTPLRDLRKAHPDAEYVLIDDLDKLLLPRGDLPIPPEEISRLEVLVKDLSDITEAQGKSTERKIKLLVTTTGRFFDFVSPRPSYQRILNSLPGDLKDHYSSMPQRIAPVQLDPWELGWSRDWTHEFAEIFQDEMKSPRLLQLWGKAILDQSGGHPALFSPVLEKLAESAKAVAKHPNAVPPVYRHLLGSVEPSDNDVNVERLIRRKAGEWIDDQGIHPLARMIRRLRDSDDSLGRNVFGHLSRIAAQEEGAEAPEGQSIRNLLRFEYGLVYEDSDTGDFRVAGDYLRRVIGSLAHGRHTVRIEPDPLAPRRGVIHVQTPAGEKSVRLNFRKWQLFQILYEKRGELVTLTEILQRTKLTKRAVQNLVTRLRQRELREINLEIANERDRGYRLVLPDVP